ncbi:matrix-remodeling-associated protein 5 [Xenentodon cancila]
MSLLQLLLLLKLLALGSSAACPRPCSCPQPAELHCTFRTLVTIPAVESKHVERMNLGFNSINEITGESLAGLRKLELLMLHGNNIQELPDEAFRDLASLQMLKMSYNKLKEINRRTLWGLWSVVRLHLDHNRLEFIHPDSFQGLTSLRLLQLEGNRLQQVHPATFTTFTLMGRFHISTLRHLYLSDNGLTSLPADLVESIPQLENLYLHGNPWTCDCSATWFHEWERTAPGVLKCKKDRSLPNGQLCPVCSSPRHLRGKELQAVDHLVCRRPVISSARRKTPPLDTETEVLTAEDFEEPIGNMSLGLSDEHGNEVDLECSVGEPSKPTALSWEQVNRLQLVSNITFSADLECPVDRGKYEQLWRLIAYYSAMPAHLERDAVLAGDPHSSHTYRQDSVKDALHYTGLKVNMRAHPAWLMQASADLQLNRLRSSATMVRLILRTNLSGTVETDLVRRQRRTWVMTESTNTTRKAFSAIVGSPSQLSCNIQSSEQPVIQWVLPDGSQLLAPYSSPDSRVSASTDGRLLIKAASHTDAGIYYCISRVPGDLAVLPLLLTVQEPPGPRPGEDLSATSIEEFAGNHISLDCASSGSPDPDINWILPGSIIIGFHANSSRALVYSNGTLHVPQIQVSDSGYYKCIAMNQHGVDTRATKIHVVRRKGLIRPVRRFPARPQSASGVSTQIRVPTDDTEEASGDAEAAQGGATTARLDAFRRRDPGGVAQRRRVIHPTRTMRQRPQVLRKPVGSRVENRTGTAETRRRVNMSKSKIDPEKWADILAKIRDRNTQNAMTPLPVRREAPEKTTTPQKTSGVLPNSPTAGAKESQESFTAQTPVRHTQTRPTKPKTQGQQATTEPHRTRKEDGVQHTTRGADTDPQTSSNSSFFLPQTTSAPPHAVTPWQADLTEASQGRENGGGPDAAAASRNDTGPLTRGGQRKPSLGPKELATSQEEKDFSETGTLAPPHSPTAQQSEATPTAASPTSGFVTSSTAKATSERRPFPQRQQPNSRVRNGGRKKRPNRRKQKATKPNTVLATTPMNAPVLTAGTTASTELKIESFGVFSTAAPFPNSRETSSGRLSHKESTVSFSLAASPFDSHLPSTTATFKRTSAVPPSPTAAPSPGHGDAPSQPATGVSVGASVRDQSEIFATPQRFTESPPPSGSLSEQTVNVPADVEPPLHSDRSFGGFPTVTRSPTDTENTQPGLEVTLADHSGKFLRKQVAPSTASSNQHPTGVTSANTSTGLNGTSSAFFQDYSESEQVAAVPLDVPEGSGSAQDKMTRMGFSETAVTGPTPPSATSLATRPVTLDVAKVPISCTGAETTPSPRPSAQYPPITAGQLFSSTREASLSPEQKLAVTPPTLTDRKLDGGQVVQQTAAYLPTTAQTVLTSTRDAFREPQPAGRGSAPRETPRSTQAFSQTIAVKAETDARLPCEAEGQPVPFLLWTHLATGMTLSRNNRVQRFEVDQNGTLIIRNTRVADGGRYLCTVQSQYGIDKRVVKLVVQSPAPHPQYRNVTVHLGGKVGLECKVEGHPEPRVTWVLPSNVHVAAASAGMPSQQRVGVDGHGILRISQANYSDSGIYMCTSSSAAGTDTAVVRLYVLALPPTIQQTQRENLALPEGSSAYIDCTAVGAPKPVIRWITPEGIQLTASQLVTGRNFIVFPNGTLYIRELVPGNSGRYECSASNTVSSSWRTVILSVKKNLFSAKASIASTSPQKTDVIYGSTLLLDCVARGAPEPRIIWRTPSKKLVDAQYSFDPRINVFLNGTISVHSVTDEDSGDYLCLARNKMGDDYVQLRVNVLTRPAKIEQKQQRSSQEVVHGENLKVDCVASGLPNPKISWVLPDGTMVNLVKQRDGGSGGRSRRYVVFDNGTLYFNDVGMPEEGDYTCYAENQLGKDEMKVRVRVKGTTSPPKIQDKDQKAVRVFYGETVTLQCKAKGEPVPVITWMSPMKRVISPALDKYQVLDDGTLIVQKVQRFDGGNYTCIVRNSAGQDHKVTSLEVLVTPPVINGLGGTANVIQVAAVQDQDRWVDCVAKGTPTPRIMWILPRNVIFPAPYYSNRLTIHLNGTLELRSPKKTDSGQLVCIARNEGGEARLVVHLDVKEGIERPKTTSANTESLSLTLGDAVTLNCSFEGLRLPQLTWILPDGTLLHSGARFSKFFHRPDGSLVIANPSVAEVGVYRCQGRHSGAVMERKVTLSSGRKPEIKNRYMSLVSIMTGETLLLDCQTTGEPLRLAWTLPSGVVLNRPQRAGRYAVLPNGTLAIQHVSVHDRGAYVCRAANEYGSSLLSVSVIVIAQPPRITSGPPSVTYTKRGVAVQLNCVATGSPKVEVAWETPDKMRLAVTAQPRLFGNKYLHPQGSLIIQNPGQRDAGVYRCTARNAVGVVSKATFLNVF